MLCYSVFAPKRAYLPDLAIRNEEENIMRLEHLYYLSALAKYDSQNKAAEELFISQSTLRSAICSLEDELEVALVSSTRQGTQLTAFGRRVVQESALILDYIEGWKRDAKVSCDIKEDIVIGITQIDSYIIFQNNILDIKKDYPNLTLRLVRRSALEIIQKLKLGKYCMGIILAAEEDETEIQSFIDSLQLNLKLMYEDSIALYINEQNPLADYPVTAIDDFLPYCYCGYSQLEMWPNEKNNFFTQGFNEENVIHVDTAENILNLISKDPNSYAIMLKSWENTPCFPAQVISKEIVDLQKVKLNHYLIHKDVKKMSLGEKILFTEIQDAFLNFMEGSHHASSKEEKNL